MSKEVPQISEAEFEVMKVVWDCCPVSTNEICHQVAMSHPWNQKTIQTLIKRLNTKGAIDYEKKGRMFYYFPLVSREDYISRETHSFLERYYQGHVGELVSGLLCREELSPKDLQSLYELLEEKVKEDCP